MQLSFLGRFYIEAARYRLSNKAMTERLEWHEALIHRMKTDDEILRLSRADLQRFCEISNVNYFGGSRQLDWRVRSL